MGRLDGKVAIITGAAMGQGAAEFYLFAKEGAKVVGADIAMDQLQEMTDKINAEFPGSAICCELNINNEQQWENVVAKAVEAFGKIDILINNAAVGSKGKDIFGTSKEEFDAHMMINAYGPWCGIQKVAPIMKQNGGGSIVNISSLCAVVGVELNSYTLTKGAVLSMTRGAAIALGKDHIRVNTIVPGTIMTPMTQMLKDMPAVLKACENKTAVKYLGEPNDIAYGALYLASDEAKYVTGSDLTIDGGERFNDYLDLTL